ncbi:NADH dehydrogenase [ubiquinone] 1 alpha subcomplex subunit 10-like protein [Leptotrombidium deliense]|uniref:NADH dehydrogenase [ubiquinone] 1 alpha subcomplex subunit 10-like protein n=1 Tax=Leptotrombidium deliense TaxID=299467 RepID=A0A443SKF4_9ACAR|nr:NADH dehydrogenase [ubiquinone] 1 alpha subcomplex subunit 10-like protein [Leptotrombidium deliense]
MATLRTSFRLYSFSVFGVKTGASTFLKCTTEARVIQHRFICRKEHLDPEVVAAKPKPYPYERKKYNKLRQAFFLDETTTRWDENSKVIAVDGPIGVGKEKFAKQLAEMCGMKYVPEPDMNAICYDDYGFDMRQLNVLLPEEAQFYNLEMFHQNPLHHWAGAMQYEYLRQRSFHYLNGLAHLYNTGQGFVTVRSPWSDIVFMDTMYKHGYFTAIIYIELFAAFNYYYRGRKNTLWEYQRPHLQIYLDISPELSLQRIKSKPEVVSMEAKSKVLNLEFLTTLNDQYKNQFLPEIYKASELLVYDWSKEGDMDEVIEDLEKLDFEQYNLKGDRLEDWRTYPDYKFLELRTRYTNEMNFLAHKFDMPAYNVEGMKMNMEAAEIRQDVLKFYYPNYGKDPYYDPKIHGYLKVLLRFFPNYRERHVRDWKCKNS